MPDVETTDVTYLTKQEVAKRFRVKTRTIENWVRENKFPAPLKVSYKKALWSLDDIVAYEMKLRESCGIAN